MEQGQEKRNGRSERLEAYEETMSRGALQYTDVLEVLNDLGLPGSFTQTGGMCAAVEVILEGGASLLITDEEDTLSWKREEHVGWGVGLYRQGEDQDTWSSDRGDVVRFASTGDSSLEALVEVVREVMLGNEIEAW